MNHAYNVSTQRKVHCVIEYDNLDLGVEIVTNKLQFNPKINCNIVLDIS